MPTSSSRSHRAQSDISDYSPQSDRGSWQPSTSTVPTVYRSSTSSDLDRDAYDYEADEHDTYYHQRPLTAGDYECSVYDSRDSLPEQEPLDSPWYPDGDRPSTAHARLQEARPPPPPRTMPATSKEFAELFPSSRELRIRHDDATVDGNMNLRIDTTATTTMGYTRDMILFHLRMYDLKSRAFSLRRYCRDSGREICHTIRKSHKAGIDGRANVQRSLSNALAAIKSKADAIHHHHHHQHSRHSSEGQALAVPEQQGIPQPPAQDKGTPLPTGLQRHDSGYDSLDDEDDDEEVEPQPSQKGAKPANGSNDSDPINLEFSNYAHVDMRRRGFKSHKRYDFDYWGVGYSWNVVPQKVGHVTEVSYNLLRRDRGDLVARISPEPLSEREARLEAEMGGWIPPCRMRVTDEQLLSQGDADLADVVVTTGLLALVDDSIRRHFHKAGMRQLIIPLPKKLGGGGGRASNRAKGAAVSKGLMAGPTTSATGTETEAVAAGAR